MRFIHFYIKKAQSSRETTKSDQFTGQVARSKVAYLNFAPLNVNSRIENLLNFRAFWYQFPILAALCYELNC